MLEVVRGTVIGEFTRKVELVGPSGRVQCSSSLTYEDDPVKWGEKEKAKLLSQSCGDGKPISAHPGLEEEIWGKGEWSVRIYN